MPLRVEFYGIARQRAGVGEIELPIASRATLAEVLGELRARLPRFGKDCIDGEQLARSFAANLDGDQFISDPSTPIRSGQCLLILSADAGG